MKGKIHRFFIVQLGTWKEIMDKIVEKFKVKS